MQREGDVGDISGEADSPRRITTVGRVGGLSMDRTGALGRRKRGVAIDAHSRHQQFTTDEAPPVLRNVSQGIR